MTSIFVFINNLLFIILNVFFIQWVKYVLYMNVTWNFMPFFPPLVFLFTFFSCHKKNADVILITMWLKLHNWSLCEILVLWWNFSTFCLHIARTGYQAPKIKASGRGAPKIHITKEQLELFINVNMKAPKIAGLLGTSESTVKRRLR